MTSSVEVHSYTEAPSLIRVISVVDAAFTRTQNGPLICCSERRRVEQALDDLGAPGLCGSRRGAGCRSRTRPNARSTQPVRPAVELPVMPAACTRGRATVAASCRTRQAGEEHTFAAAGGDDRRGCSPTSIAFTSGLNLKPAHGMTSA